MIILYYPSKASSKQNISIYRYFALIWSFYCQYYSVSQFSKFVLSCLFFHRIYWEVGNRITTRLVCADESVSATSSLGQPSVSNSSCREDVILNNAFLPHSPLLPERKKMIATRCCRRTGPGCTFCKTRAFASKDNSRRASPTWQEVAMRMALCHHCSEPEKIFPSGIDSV